MLRIRIESDELGEIYDDEVECILCITGKNAFADDAPFGKAEGQTINIIPMSNPQLVTACIAQLQALLIKLGGIIETKEEGEQ